MKKETRIWIFPLITMGLVLMLTNSCNKADVIVPVTVSASLTTSAVSGITQTTAISGGNVTSDGGATVTARGVCWRTSATPTITDSITTDGAGTGSFTSSITGLTANTTYNARAYATNSAGTGYGSAVSFTTQPVLIAVLTTSAVSNIALTTATSGGNVTSDGSSTVTARGVCWSTGTTPTIADSKTTDGAGTGSFTSSITGLTANTTYNIRAYATNSAGTGYGSVISFTTPQLPVLTTSAVTDIRLTTATSGGNVTSAGSSTVTARGVCWSTSTAPTIADSKTNDGAGTGGFTSSLTGLTRNTTYYVKAYATNGAGTAYGNEITITTYGLIDIDGNGYHSIIIKTQEWMKENLKTTTYRDGSAIPNVTDVTDWVNLSTGAYSDFNNNTGNVATYGRLYNGYSVIDPCNVCPAGWHVPSLNEWDILINTLGGENIAGGKMKSIGTLQNGDGLWYSPNTGATNESGFTGLPGGTRFDLGDFRDLHSFGHWLSSDSGFGFTWSIRLQDNHTRVEKFNNYSRIGKSIRCIKD